MPFYLLNRAKNYADFMHALDYYDSPGQNFAFASASGNIAIRVQGKYPVRRKNEGRFLLDGTISSNGWQAFIPNEQNIYQLNPERGFVTSSNQYPADSTYPYYIMTRSYDGFRNRRISLVLDSLSGIRVNDMMKLQNDNYNFIAADILPHLLSKIELFSLDQKEKDIYELLSNWDFYNDPDSEAASYFEEWWDTLFLSIWDEIQNSNATLSNPSKYTTIKLIKEQPDLIFFDNQETSARENADLLIKYSFTNSIDKVNNWQKENKDTVRWADYKNTLVQHLARLAPFSKYVQNGGNHDIVNATSSRHGPSWRMIVSLEPNGVKAWGVYPGGQSGNPGSPYYLNMIDKWEKGEYFQLTFMHDETDIKSSRKQILSPAKP